MLIVDDEKLFSRNLAESLRLEGWEAEAVFGGRAAIEAVRKADFDVVLLDMRMPEMDGFESLERLLKIRPNLCVVFLTAYGDVDTAVRALHEGAVSMVLKPLTVDAIKGVAEKSIELRKAQIEARDKEKAEALLTLAVGLSHKIHNELFAVGCVVHTVEKATSLQDVASCLPKLKENLLAADLAVRRLYHYAKVKQTARVPASLRAAALRAIETARRRRSSLAKPQTPRVDLRMPSDLEVVADPELLVEAIECVVDNAMEVTQQGGRIIIAGSIRNGMAELAVRDTGPGFSPDMLSEPIQAFKTSRKNTHVGFGLFFAQEVIKAFGGALERRNAEDPRGAVVTVTLPASEASSNHTAQEGLR
jgi:FixJ family two-component response regulator/anti-sigma regulatory factor (Ser/Thr protein kinase)